MDCSKENDGCHGGNIAKAFKYIDENGITDETCNVYKALSWFEKGGTKCDEYSVCKECRPDGTCYQPEEFKKYEISKWGSISGEENMKAEIAGRGPIACALNSIPLHNVTSLDVVTSNSTGGLTHVISVVGYGTNEKK